MSNPNPYAGERMASNDVVDLMRRINAIEKRTFRHYASWGTYGIEFDSTCLMTAGGGELFVLGGLAANPNDVRVYAPDGTYKRTWTGSFSGRFCWYNNEVYCADGTNGVKVYDINGNLNRSWAAVTHAEDIAVDHTTAEVYVLDRVTLVTSQVIKSDTSGVEESRWDVEISGGTQRRGYGIAASRGLVFVNAASATSVDDIYVWRNDGLWFGTMGYSDASVWQPSGAIDAHDGIFMVAAPSSTYDMADTGDPLWVSVKRHGGSSIEYYGSGFYNGDNTQISSDSRFGTPFSFITRETTTVAGDHDDVTTTLNVNGDFTNPSTPPFIISVGATLVAGNERMRVTNKVGNAWTVERGYGGSTAVGHSNGDGVYYIYETSELPEDGDIFYPTEICFDGDYCYVFQHWHHDNSYPLADDYGARYVTVFTHEQTEWYSYTKTVKTHLGTPDGGETTPDRRALYVNGAKRIRNHITDMRDAIENLFATQVRSWNVTAFANAYYASMGTRTAYGATGGIRTDWTKADTAMAGTRSHDIDIGEVFEIVNDMGANSYNSGWSYL